MKDKIKEKYKKLLFKYQLVILNEDSLEERFNLRLNRFNVFTFVALSLLLVISATVLLIAHTPLKEYVIRDLDPYNKESLALALKVDSLDYKIGMQKHYVSSLRKVLTGKIDHKSFNRDSIETYSKKDIKAYNMKANREDSLLRQEVANEDKFNVLPFSTSDFLFEVPLKGKISSKYSIEDGHYGLDISASKTSPVKAISSGVVISSGWMVDTSYTVIIIHRDHVISVYKHNKILYKKEGDFVKSGEVIASVGDTGETSTGYHLHLEIWIDGYAINPENVINFE